MEQGEIPSKLHYDLVRSWTRIYLGTTMKIPECITFKGAKYTLEIAAWKISCFAYPDQM